MAERERVFSYHWGSGIVAEQAQCEGQWQRPTIQLLQYTEGEAAGGVSIRFCSYTRTGRFSRSPLLLSEDDVEGLRASLAGAPRLMELLKRLVAEPGD